MDIIIRIRIRYRKKIYVCKYLLKIKHNKININEISIPLQINDKYKIKNIK
jgi:hypothetical protein